MCRITPFGGDVRTRYPRVLRAVVNFELENSALRIRVSLRIENIPSDTRCRKPVGRTFSYWALHDGHVLFFRSLPARYYLFRFLLSRTCVWRITIALYRRDDKFRGNRPHTSALHLRGFYTEKWTNSRFWKLATAPCMNVSDIASYICLSIYFFVNAWNALLQL